MRAGRSVFRPVVEARLHLPAQVGEYTRLTPRRALCKSGLLNKEQMFVQTHKSGIMRAAKRTATAQSALGRNLTNHDGAESKACLHKPA